MARARLTHGPCLDQTAPTRQEAARPAAVLLQKRAMEMCSEQQAKRRRAKDAKEAARADREQMALQRAEALVRHETLRKKTMELQHALDQERAARVKDTAIRKAKDKWLQTEFPAQLAQRLRGQVLSLPEAQKVKRERMLQLMARENWFRFFPRVNALWECQPKWLQHYCDEKSYVGGGKRAARCSASFACFLEEVYIRHIDEPRCAQQALLKLLDWVFPKSTRYVFVGPRSVHSFLHLNEYVIDKCFVHCVVCLAKWLTPGNWPEGQIDWPPPVPHEVLADIVGEDDNDDDKEPASPPPLPPPGMLTAPSAAAGSGDASASRGRALKGAR